MAAYPSPITAENFKAAWKYIARKQRWSMKKSLIRRLAVMLAQIVYGCVFVILAIGIIYEKGGESARLFLDQIPVVIDWSCRISAAVLEGAPEGSAWIFRCMGLMYLLPFCVAIPPAALVILLYHPITPKQTGNMGEDAWQLWDMAKRAQEAAGKRWNDTAVVFSGLLGLFVIMFALGELSGSEQGPMQAVLYGAGVVLCYHAVNLPLRLLLKALHLCYIPKTMTADAERCHAQLKSPASENSIDPEK